MALADPLRPTPLVAFPAQWLLAFLIGTAGATLVVAVSSFNPLYAVAASVVIPVMAIVVVRPRLGMLLLIFLISFMEEFRGGIGDTKGGGDEALRSERLPFYSVTLGLPGLYIPDVLIGGLTFLYCVKLALWRERSPFIFDRIGVALLLIAASLFVSIVVSLARPDSFGPMVLDLSSLGSIKLPEKNVSDVARYFPILHFKLFALLFPSYLLGMFFFREERDVRQMLLMFGLAMIATIGLASYRLIRDPTIIKTLTPVVFDTGSVTFMLMTVFYCAGMWAYGRYRIAQTVVRSIFCVLLLLFILLSFRRTLWGAAAMGVVILPFLMPPSARWRLLMLGGLGMCVVMIILGATPPGQLVLQSLVSRASETNLNQSSTLYRFALLVWLVDRFDDLPLLGYGVLPLWGEIVRIRYFFISMENVHSLFLWILLRTGVIGMLVWIFALYLILSRMRAVYRAIDDDRNRIIIVVIFLSIIMLMFNGIFNPVYANVRHIVPLGVSLALISRFPALTRSKTGGALQAS